MAADVDNYVYNCTRLAMITCNARPHTLLSAESRISVMPKAGAASQRCSDRTYHCYRTRKAGKLSSYRTAAYRVRFPKQVELVMESGCAGEDEQDGRPDL